MKIVCEFKYAVIQFLEQPCSSIDEYICIPQSWIRVRRVTDRKSLVAYPSESPSLIEKRVKRAEMVSEKWSLYMAIVKHETNSYEDAYNYIMARRYDSTTDNGCSRTITAEHELLPATTPEINSSSRKRIKQSNNRQKRLKVVDDAKLTSHSSPSPAMVARNTLHAALDPLILANQISQGVYLTQGNQQASTYQDHLQRIVLNHEIHRRTISNLQTLLPDFLTNQKVSQGSRQSTPFTAQNPTKNDANQFSQIPNTSSVHKDHSQVLHTQEIPASQSSNVNCTNYVPSSYSGTMYVSSTPVSTSNSEGQTTFPTQYLDVNQQPVVGNHSHQDPSVQEIIVDGSTEVNYIEQSFSSEQCTENESSAIQNSQNNSIECSMKKSPVDKVTKDDRSSTQDVDNVNEQSSTEKRTEEILTNQIPFDQEGLSVDSITNIEDLWLDRMAGLFERMNSDFLNTCKMAHEMHESLVQSAKTFQCIASVSANLRKLKTSKATAEKPKDVTVESKKVAEKEQVEKEKEKSDVDMAEKDDNEAKKSDDNKKVAEKKRVEIKEKEKSDVEMAENKNDSVPKNGDDNDESSNDDKNTDQDKEKNKDDAENKDNDEDKGEETPKKIRGCIRAFVLPPEYDPNDTKWTLKYRKPDSKIKKLGLVELVEKSRVYINAIKLAHCKRVSKDSKTLARMLLVEVFSQKALSVCSLTGARANAFDMKGENVRPGLDEHARMVILSFVEEHARLKGWGPFDTQSVINSIRSKIQEIRAKYSQNPTET